MSFLLTTPVYLFHRAKTELQCKSLLVNQARMEGQYLYPFVVKHIINTQGLLGLASGFLPKVISNAWLIAGVSLMLEQGRANSQKTKV